MSLPSDYDIMIIGGGMVGASLACALRDTALRIALVDASPVVIPDDPRLIALNHSSYCLLKNLDVWPNLAEHAAAIEQVHVSDRGHFGKVRLKAGDLHLSALGYVVPAKYINAALQKTLDTLPQVKIFRPAKLKKLSQEHNQVNVTIETESGELKLSSPLLVGADGTHSTVRKELGITTQETDYHQSALVTITTLNRSHQGIAYERFHTNGAIAMLPLTEQCCATIWSDTTDKIHTLSLLRDADFLKTLQENFGYHLGRLKQIARRHVYPLKMLRSDHIVQNRVLLIGNAAHTLHPIAAQGLNLALSEIAMLAQTLSEQTSPEYHWENFITWQTQQQKSSTGLSHHTPNLFSQQSALLTSVRQLGMLGLDLCPSAKKHFSLRAMGRTGAIPRLLLD